MYHILSLIIGVYQVLVNKANCTNMWFLDKITSVKLDAYKRTHGAVAGPCCSKCNSIPRILRFINRVIQGIPFAELNYTNIFREVTSCWLVVDITCFKSKEGTEKNHDLVRRWGEWELCTKMNNCKREACVF